MENHELLVAPVLVGGRELLPIDIVHVLLVDQGHIAIVRVVLLLVVYVCPGLPLPLVVVLSST